MITRSGKECCSDQKRIHDVSQRTEIVTE